MTSVDHAYSNTAISCYNQPVIDWYPASLVYYSNLRIFVSIVFVQPNLCFAGGHRTLIKTTVQKEFRREMEHNKRVRR